MAQWQRIPLQYRGGRRLGFDPWVRMVFWRRKWQPTPVFLPEKSHGQGSLEGYSPGGRRVRHDWPCMSPHLAMWVCSLWKISAAISLPRSPSLACSIWLLFPAAHWNCLAKAKSPNPVNTFLVLTECPHCIWLKYYWSFFHCWNFIFSASMFPTSPSTALINVCWISFHGLWFMLFATDPNRIELPCSPFCSLTRPSLFPCSSYPTCLCSSVGLWP